MGSAQRCQLHRRLISLSLAGVGPGGGSGGGGTGGGVGRGGVGSVDSWDWEDAWERMPPNLRVCILQRVADWSTLLPAIQCVRHSNASLLMLTGRDFWEPLSVYLVISGPFLSCRCAIQQDEVATVKASALEAAVHQATDPIR